MIGARDLPCLVAQMLAAPAQNLNSGRDLGSFADHGLAYDAIGADVYVRAETRIGMREEGTERDAAR